MKSGKTGRTVLLWSVTALAAGAVLVWYALDTGAEASFTAPGRDLRLTDAAPVDLNTATAEELDDLPGIGPALAERIVSFRRENGPFRSPEDVMDVPGVGPAVYGDMAPYIGGEEEAAEDGEDTGSGR